MSVLTLLNDINGLFKDIGVKIYDPEQKKLIGVFNNFAKAANKLGVTSSVIRRKCSTKNRVFSPFLQKEITCRTAKLTAEDEILINKTKINWL